MATLITVREYARKCGLSPAGAWNRIKSGIISTVLVDLPGGEKREYVDTDVHKPTKARLKSGRKKQSK